MNANTRCSGLLGVTLLLVGGALIACARSDSSTISNNEAATVFGGTKKTKLDDKGCDYPTTCPTYHDYDTFEDDPNGSPNRVNGNSCFNNCGTWLFQTKDNQE